MTARLFTLNPLEGFRPKTFAGHRDAVVSAYFSADGKTVRHYPDFTSKNPYTGLDIHCQQRRRCIYMDRQSHLGR